MEFKEFIKKFITTTKNIIEKVEEYKTISGKEKKQEVDRVVEKYVLVVVDSLQLNFVFKFVLKKLLVENIPTITQGVFDLIKTKVNGITK